MTTTRRDFLKRGSLVALAAGVPLSRTQKVHPVRLEKTAAGKESLAGQAGFGLTRAAFEAQLNSRFVFHDSKGGVPTQLVRVADLSPTHTVKQAGREGFSLLFRSAHATTLKQDTYLIEHDELGMFSFLIVPMNNMNGGDQHYEAIINRLYP